MKTGEFARRMKNGEPQSNEHASGEQVADAAGQAVLLRSRESCHRASRAKSESPAEAVEDGLNEKAVQTQDNGSPAKKINHRVLLNAGALNLFELELVSPNDDRPPNELIEKHDDGDHTGDAPQNRAGVAVARGGLQERAKSLKANVAAAQRKQFARPYKKPAAPPSHHRMPTPPTRQEE